MAHQLRYYKEIESQGHTWRVDFYQDTEDTVDVQVIGPVLQGLRLVMQGDQADIDTPIVKTSLEMTFVDAPDMEGEGKTGYWEEFYTSSATEWMVKLWKDGVIEWSGFVTPDSFSEDLRYRGSVNIIARDNLGYLDDLFFSYSDPFINVLQIISSAFNAGNIAIDWSTGYKDMWSPNYSSPLNLRFNSALFEGKTWWEAMEIALRSIGYVMRYKGSNTYIVGTMRSIGLSGELYWWEVPEKDVSFLSYGHREFSPAVKSIIETVNFDIEENIADFEMTQDSYTETSELMTFYKTEVEEINSGIYQEVRREYELPVFEYHNALWGGTVTADKSLLLNPYKYAYKEGFYSPDKGGEIKSDNMLLVAMNQVPDTLPLAEKDRCVTYQTYVNSGSLAISMDFGYPVALYDNQTTIGDYTNKSIAPSTGFSWFRVSRFYFIIRWEGVSGAELQYNGSEWADTLTNTLTIIQLDSNNWMEETFLQRYSTQINIAPLTITEPGTITIKFYGAVGSGGNTTNGSEGLYLRWSNLSITAEGDLKTVDKRKTTTNYNENNNIVLKRESPAAIYTAKMIAPAMVKNGMVMYENGEYTNQNYWRFHSKDILQPLEVLVHQQLLAYYSKPNNILSGELMDAGGQVPDFSSLWMWNGKEHMLTSGTLNILTGRMENAVLREFTRYDHMWETWVENEDVTLDYAADQIQFLVHHQPFRELSVTYLPSWITLKSIMADMSNLSVVILSVMGNGTGMDREAIFNIDTAAVRVTQRAAGDYNIDYGEDYS